MSEASSPTVAVVAIDSEANKSELVELCEEGHRLLARWNPDDPQEVQAAKDEFDRKKREGYLIFAVGRFGRKGHEIKNFFEVESEARILYEFDPKAQRQVAVKPVVGG